MTGERHEGALAGFVVLGLKVEARESGRDFRERIRGRIE